MTDPLGALLGVLSGAAVLLLVSWARARRPRRILDRIAPFVQVPGLASSHEADPTVSVSRVRSLIGGAPPTDDDLPARMARAGRSTTPGGYRVERAAWAAAGSLTTALLLVALAAGGDGSAVPGVVMVAGAAVAGWAACDLRLRQQGRRRCSVVERQLPTLADLVALAVSAGATPLAALELAGETVGGPLGADVRHGVQAVHGGASVEAGLRAVAAVSGIPAVDRFVDTLVVAVQRGSPLAEVVRAQAEDLRATERRRLMESAGRKDVAMLVPIVFLVLPAVVVIALLPGIRALQLIVP